MTADERGAPPVALVTGANRGIGFEVCRQLAQEGIKVFLGVRDPEKAESAAQELSEEGLDVVPRTVDVSEDESVGRLTTELKDTGILVNAVCPGLVATSPEAEAISGRPVPEGAASVVWASTRPDDGSTGGFFRGGKPLPW